MKDEAARIAKKAFWFVCENLALSFAVVGGGLMINGQLDPIGWLWVAPVFCLVVRDHIVKEMK